MLKSANSKICNHARWNSNRGNRIEIFQSIILNKVQIVPQTGGILYMKFIKTGYMKEDSVKESRGQPINGTLKQAIIG